MGYRERSIRADGEGSLEGQVIRADGEGSLKGQGICVGREDSLERQELGNREGEPACCITRHKERSEEEVRSLVHRLNRIEGQIRGIRGMVEKGAYCPDILIQSAAVTAAMNSFNRELLASHVRTCVVEDIRGGDEGTVDELVKLLQKLMK